MRWAGLQRPTGYALGIRPVSNLISTPNWFSFIVAALVGVVRIVSLTEARSSTFICIDEFGPLNLMPRPGKGWFPAGQPKRLRATYHRTAGVQHMFAALDLASGEMFYRIRDRKRWSEFLDFLRQIRRRFPTGRLYVVLDNYSPHKKAEVAAWCAANDVEPVFTPSNASWLNWIECEFTALRYFTLDGSDYPSHDAQQAAIARYIRWRNNHARPQDPLRNRVENPATGLPALSSLMRH